MVELRAAGSESNTTEFPESWNTGGLRGSGVELPGDFGTRTTQPLVEIRDTGLGLEVKKWTRSSH